jgi:hypothetical protein
MANLEQIFCMLKQLFLLEKHSTSNFEYVQSQIKGTLITSTRMLLVLKHCQS